MNGKPCDLDSALDKAAQMLSGARAPALAGFGADIAGVRAGLRLARAAGAVFDPLTPAFAAELRAKQDRRFMFVTPGEAKSRADLVAAVGDEALRYARALFDSPPALGAGAGKPRALLAIAGSVAPSVKTLAAPAHRVAGVIAALAASVKRPQRTGEAAAFAQALKEARYGVIAFSAGELGALGVEALMELVESLNAATRFSCLPTPHADNAAGAVECALWTTGFPGRISFASGDAEYDPWRFDARRMADAGECDAAVWVSAFRPQAPSWRGAGPTIALTGPGAGFAKPPEVHFAVGKPGVDHPGEFFDDEHRALAAFPAADSGRLSAAAVLDAIALRVERRSA
ncbi:MAG: formyltransferase [Hyphomicrobiales bacterium]|nr:formyltransferase [Hyphomicrobiales bacterium]